MRLDWEPAEMDVGRRDTLPGPGATENPGRVLHLLETLQDLVGSVDETELDGGRDGWGSQPRSPLVMEMFSVL